MTYYIVRVISKATQNNPNFAGRTSIAYYGKDQQLLGMEGTVHDYLNDSIKIAPNMIKLYGYKRKCDAARSYVYNNCCSTQYWTKQVDIVEVGEENL